MAVHNLGRGGGDNPLQTPHPPPPPRRVCVCVCGAQQRYAPFGGCSAVPGRPFWCTGVVPHASSFAATLSGSVATCPAPVPRDARPLRPCPLPQDGASPPEIETTEGPEPRGDVDPDPNAQVCVLRGMGLWSGMMARREGGGGWSATGVGLRLWGGGRGGGPQPRGSPSWEAVGLPPPPAPVLRVGLPPRPPFAVHSGVHRPSGPACPMAHRAHSTSDTTATTRAL